jgi:hypothetical protein
MSTPKKSQDAGKKVRADSVLGNLSEERRERIEEWAATPKSETCVGGLQFALEQLAADGIKVSISTLSEFLKYRRFSRRFSFASSRADQVAELLKQRNPNMSPEAVRELAQTVFTLEALDSGDADTFVSLEHLKLSQDSARTKFSLEERKLQLAARRVKVMERKLDQLKGALTEGELSDGQRVQRMKQVFGL